MIDAKDLRIGNVMLLHGELIKITGIGSKGLSGNGCFSGYFPNDKECFFENSNNFQPIQITEDILRQISTKFNELDIAYFNDVFSLRLIGDWGWHTVDALGRMDKTVLYLHDLQNIYYYDNNKQELPIDIKTLNI